MPPPSCPPMFVALLVYRDLGHFAGPHSGSNATAEAAATAAAASRCLPQCQRHCVPCPVSHVPCLCPSSGCRQDFCLALFVSTVVIVVVVVLVVVCASASHVVFNKLISRSALVLRLQSVGTRTSSTSTTTKTGTSRRRRRLLEGGGGNSIAIRPSR